MSKIKGLLVAALALVALSAFAASASATEARVSPGGGIVSNSIEPTTFNASIIDIECNLEMTGELAEGPIEVVEGRVFGTMNTVEPTECVGGSVTEVLNLPYDLSFNGLTETGLEFDVDGAAFELQVIIFGIPVRCLYGGNVPALVELNSGVTGDISITANNIPKQGGAGSCPSTGSMSGEFTLEEQQTITLI